MFSIYIYIYIYIYISIPKLDWLKIIKDWSNMKYSRAMSEIRYGLSYNFSVIFVPFTHIIYVCMPKIVEREW